MKIIIIGNILLKFLFKIFNILLEFDPVLFLDKLRLMQFLF